MPEEATPQTIGGFYDAALTRAEQRRLARARRVQGIDEEIAVLRSRIYALLQDRPDGVEWLLGPVAALARLIALRHRISPEAREGLAESLAGVLSGVGAALGLEDFHDAAV